jgi:hypothetical protein
MAPDKPSHLTRGGYDISGLLKPLGPEKPPPKDPKADDKKDPKKDPKDKK